VYKADARKAQRWLALRVFPLRATVRTVAIVGQHRLGGGGFAFV